MGNFFAELKRRHIYRVAAAYAVVAWVLLQLANNVVPALNLPGWAVTLVLVLLIGGFPVALLFAWIHQLTPTSGAPARATTSNLDWFLAAALVAVIALVSYQQLASAPSARTAQQAGIAAGAPSPAGISIAVLPFANMSGDAGQEFFSDGMTEEITAALAKIPSLRVVARTSAFAFKGQNQDMRAVGQALGASHLIEGSVRKAGDRVRITAQLIKADDGTHLWAENYDRQLTDIFATQEDIAQAIAGALRVPLGLQQGESLVPNRTADLDSYQQYLLARSLVRARTLDRALAILEPLVARDPNYAPASALLADVEYLLAVFFDPALRTGSIEEARRAMQSSLDSGAIAAKRAIQADSKNALAYGALASVQYVQMKWADAEDLFRQVLTLDPNDPEILQAYSNFLNVIGRLKDALTAREKQRMLEPFVPIYTWSLANSMQLNGQIAASIPVLEALPSDAAGGYYRDVFLAQAYAVTGRFKEAADTLLLITGNQVSRQSVEGAARLLRQAPANVGAPETLPRFDSELNFVYAYVGALDRAMEFPERTAKIGYLTSGAHYPLWHPSFAPLRKTERLKAYVRKVGLVDYWRARGWPDLCRPTTGNDFECS
jgi:TolB-like protein